MCVHLCMCMSVSWGLSDLINIITSVITSLIFLISNLAAEEGGGAEMGNSKEGELMMG